MDRAKNREGGGGLPSGGTSKAGTLQAGHGVERKRWSGGRGLYLGEKNSCESKKLGRGRKGSTLGGGRRIDEGMGKKVQRTQKSRQDYEVRSRRMSELEGSVAKVGNTSSSRKGSRVSRVALCRSDESSGSEENCV